MILYVRSKVEYIASYCLVSLSSARLLIFGREEGWGTDGSDSTKNAWQQLASGLLMHFLWSVKLIDVLGILDLA